VAQRRCWSEFLERYVLGEVWMIYCGCCCGSDPSVFWGQWGDKVCEATALHPILLRVGAVTKRVSINGRTNRKVSEIEHSLVGLSCSPSNLRPLTQRAFDNIWPIDYILSSNIRCGTAGVRKIQILFKTSHLTQRMCLRLLRAFGVS